MTKTYKHKQTGELAKIIHTGDYYTVEERYGFPAKYIESTNDWIPVEEPWIPKVGEWVVPISNEWSAQRTKGVTYQVNEEDEDGTGCRIGEKDGKGWFWNTDLRPATPEEIAKACPTPVQPEWVITAIKNVTKGTSGDGTIRYINSDGCTYDAIGYKTKWKAEDLLKHIHEKHVIWSVKYQDTEYTVGDHIQVTEECRAHHKDLCRYWR